HNNFLFLGAQYGVGAAALYIATIAAFALYFLGNAVHGRGAQKVYALYGLLALSVLFAFGMVAAVITKNYFFFALGVMLWGTSTRPRRPKSAGRSPLASRRPWRHRP